MTSFSFRDSNVKRIRNCGKSGTHSFRTGRLSFQN